MDEKKIIFDSKKIEAAREAFIENMESAENNTPETIFDLALLLHFVKKENPNVFLRLLEKYEGQDDELSFTLHKMLSIFYALRYSFVDEIEAK